MFKKENDTFMKRDLSKRKVMVIEWQVALKSGSFENLHD